MAAPLPPQPLFSFGVVADAQYADLPDGSTEGRQQRYREVPGKLQGEERREERRQARAFVAPAFTPCPGPSAPPAAAALAALRAHQPPLAFVLHLGDIVNGNPAGQAQCDAEFDLIAGIFDAELVS